eukprot:2388008-Pleurochrysis_carterae.AAC.2
MSMRRQARDCTLHQGEFADAHAHKVSEAHAIVAGTVYSRIIRSHQRVEALYSRVCVHIIVGAGGGAGAGKGVGMVAITGLGAGWRTGARARVCVRVRVRV